MSDDIMKEIRALRVEQRRLSTPNRRVILLAPRARVILKGRGFIKARTLARLLDITPHLAGQCLAMMPEWELYNPEAHAKRTWIRRTVSEKPVL